MLREDIDLNQMEAGFKRNLGESNSGAFKEGIQDFQIVRRIDALFPIFVLQGEAGAYNQVNIPKLSI